MADDPAVYPPALFLYQVTPTAIPHSDPGSSSSVDLMFFISNTSGHDVEVNQIVFDLRYGVGPGDLTTSDRLTPKQVVGPDWSVTDFGGGRVRAAPRSLAPFRGLRAGESFGVAVPGVVVNSQPGVANLTVWETSDEPRQSYVSVAKTQPGLAISSFQAAPVQLDRHYSKSVLTWEVSGEDRITLSHDGATEDVTHLKFKEVAPRVTTLYTLTATGAGQRVHEQLTVYVPQVALISFGADPPLIARGQSSTLRWSLANAVKAEILASGSEPDPGPASLPEGTVTVTPHQPTTTYMLSASGFGNVVTGVAQVDYLPTVERFSITPEQAPIDKELPLKLAWKVRDAASVSISGLEGPRPSEGSAEVRPKQTTAYTLSAKRLTPARTVRAHLTGQLTAFEAYAPGRTIRWTGAGADRARLATGLTWHEVPSGTGTATVGPGISTLSMISTTADWVNYIAFEFYRAPGAAPAPSASPYVYASSAYGLNVAGVPVTFTWPASTTPDGIMVVDANGGHHLTDSPATVHIAPLAGNVVWRLSAPGMFWNVYAGQPWSSAAAPGSETRPPDK